MLGKRPLLLLFHQRRLYSSLVPAMSRPANAERYIAFVRQKNKNVSPANIQQFMYPKVNLSVSSKKFAEEKSVESAKNKPSEENAENKQSEESAENKQSEKSAENKQSEKSAENKQSEKRAEDKQSEKSADKQSEKSADKQSEKSADKQSEKSAEDKQSEKSAENKQSEKSAENKQSEKSAENKQSEKSADKQSEKSAEDKQSEKSEEEKKSEENTKEDKENAQPKMLPPADEIKKWDTKTLCNFLCEQNLKLEDEHLNYVCEKEIIGQNFLQMTEKDLIKVGLPQVLAKNIANLAKMINNKEQRAEIFENKDKSSKFPTELLYIFVDNSNILTEGKFSIAGHENLGTFNYDRSCLSFDKLRIDYGRLLTTVQGKRQLGNAPIIAGPSPPLEDSLWKHIKEQGYHAIAYNDEKVDSAFVYSMSEVILTKNPGILAIITSDNNYDPVIAQALKHNWIVETWGWNSAISSNLKEKTRFTPLDSHYKSFAYGCGPDVTGRSKILKISGDAIRNWRNREILDIFASLNLFGWWHWLSDDIANLYFDKEIQLRMVKHRLKNSSLEIEVQDNNSLLNKALYAFGFRKLE